MRQSACTAVLWASYGCMIDVVDALFWWQVANHGALLLCCCCCWGYDSKKHYCCCCCCAAGRCLVGVLVSLHLNTHVSHTSAGFKLGLGAAAVSAEAAVAPPA
jgi:hypothetical protein